MKMKGLLCHTHNKHSESIAMPSTLPAVCINHRPSLVRSLAPRIDDRHCRRIHSSLYNENLLFYYDLVEKHPVAGK